MNDDAQHLAQYVREGSEPAFRKLVERYLALVNSTARRMTGGNVHLAQDVTQLVFTDLARKAHSLPYGTILGGWLHRHTCYTALKALRTENRRQKRERIAMEINALDDNSGQDAHWLQLAPVLDEALNRLATRDREVIVLRYFQQQDIRSIGHDLGASETAVQKRLGRALEKLRGLLVRRGVALASATVLGSTLEAGVVTSVPAGMIATISTTAIGTAAVASTTSLTLLTLKTMITSKLALGLVTTLVVVGATTAIISHNNSASTPAVVPAASAAPAAILPAKITAPPVAITAKVEAPKIAPAPAGDAPATPADLAVAKAAAEQSSGTLTFTATGRPSTMNLGMGAVPTGTGTLILSGRNNAAAPNSVNGINVERLMANLEQFKKQAAGVIEQRTQEANGDPEKLAKIETAQVEYDQYVQDMQKKIDELSVQAATNEQSAPPQNSP